MHLVHPSGLNWEDRRVKNDYLDCRELLDRLRVDKLPEAWIAPPKVRELRELVRYRAKVVALRAGLKAQIHAALAKEGLHPPLTELWGVAGGRYLDSLELADGYQIKIESLRNLIADFDREVTTLERDIYRWLRDDRGYWAIQALPGVGPTIAAIFVAEIGDVSRFPNPQALCSWAGMTPKHRESDVKVRRGKITKQGSTIVRWAAVEAISHVKGTPKIKRTTGGSPSGAGSTSRASPRARKLLTLVYFGLRDGEIRCLAQTADAG